MGRLWSIGAVGCAFIILIAGGTCMWYYDNGTYMFGAIWAVALMPLWWPLSE